MTGVILFGGATEGRRLAEELSGRGAQVLLCVATSYGRELVRPGGTLRVRAGRLDAAGMARQIREEGCRLVADATHPYAKEASANLRAACAEAGAEYLRLVREESAGGQTTEAADAGEAAAILAREGGTALLAVGSKELAAFTAVPDYQNRLFARVLPTAEVLEKCAGLGFSGRRIIAMQGPFSAALNEAMLRQLGADWLVTKDSGEAGGFAGKQEGCRRAGARLLVIRRPQRETGYSYEGLRRELLARLGIGEKEAPPAPARFPLFIDLSKAPVAVVGGGAVALRRVRTLLACGAEVCVIAPRAVAGLADLARTGEIRWERRRYRAGDLAGTRLAAACTDDAAVNEDIAAEALARGIPCSAAHDRGAGSFWFPALVREGNLVAGIVSADGDHAAVRRAAKIMREKLGETQ